MTLKLLFLFKNVFDLQTIPPTSSSLTVTEVTKKENAEKLRWPLELVVNQMCKLFCHLIFALGQMTQVYVMVNG